MSYHNHAAEFDLQCVKCNPLRQLPPAPLLPGVSASECRELADALATSWGSVDEILNARAAAILRSVADAIGPARGNGEGEG